MTKDSPWSMAVMALRKVVNMCLFFMGLLVYKSIYAHVDAGKDGLYIGVKVFVETEGLTQAVGCTPFIPDDRDGFF